MKIKISQKDNVLIVSVDSSVLQEHIPLFKERLNELVNKDACWIVFDLMEADYLSSLGISVLLSAKTKTKKLGGDIVLANVNRLIVNLLKLTNLIDKVEIFEDVDKGVDALKKKK